VKKICVTPLSDLPDWAKPKEQATQKPQAFTAPPVVEPSPVPQAPKHVVAESVKPKPVREVQTPQPATAPTIAPTVAQPVTAHASNGNGGSNGKAAEHNGNGSARSHHHNADVPIETMIFDHFVRRNSLPVVKRDEMRAPCAVETSEFVYGCNRIEHYIPADKAIPLPIVVKPGLFSGDWQFKRFCEELASQGYECYVVNLRGHGSGPAVENLATVSIDDYAKDVVQFAESLKTRVIYLGHSAGAVICNKAAEQNPDIVAGFGSIMSAPYRWSLPSLSCLHRATRLRYVWSLLKIPGLKARKPLKLTFEDARELMFNTHATDEEACRDYATLGPESSTAILEILQWKYRLYAPNKPTIVFKGGYDHFTPHQRSIVRNFSRSLAGIYDPYYRDIHHYVKVFTSHAFMYDKNWMKVVEELTYWLRKNCSYFQ
jgi:pimeloyl-ACP methyl ester carboxylesterase